MLSAKEISELARKSKAEIDSATELAEIEKRRDEFVNEVSLAKELIKKVEAHILNRAKAGKNTAWWIPQTERYLLWQQERDGECPLYHYQNIFLLSEKILLDYLTKLGFHFHICTNVNKNKDYANLSVCIML